MKLILVKEDLEERESTQLIADLEALGYSVVSKPNEITRLKSVYIISEAE